MAKDAQYRKYQVAQLAGLARARPARLGNCRLILIDGPAGSGKTTLATKLQAELNAAVIHMDDIYLGWENALSESTTNRLIEQALIPIASSGSAKFQKFNWLTYQLDEVEEITPSILIVEGVGAAAKQIREFASLIIWIEVGQEIGLSRVLARDGQSIADQMSAWQLAEREWHQLDKTRNAADIKLLGERVDLATDEYLGEMK